jgi:hypothetical protein
MKPVLIAGMDMMRKRANVRPGWTIVSAKFCLVEGIFQVEGGLIIRGKLQTANGRTTPVSGNFRSFREGVQAMPGKRREKRAVLIGRRKRMKR